MIRIDMRAAYREVRRLHRDIDEKKIAGATQRAINRAMTQARTHGNRKVREEYAVKAGGFNKKLTIEKATNNKLWAKLKASHRPLSLMTFTGVRQNKKGVNFQVKKGHKEFMPGAFITNLPTDDGGTTKGLMVRAWYKKKELVFHKSRLKITRLNSSSPFTMLTNKRVMVEVKQKAEQDYTRRMEYEISRLLRPS